MVQEQKAKAYDEAIIKAKALYGQPLVDNTLLETIFPELKEGEDGKNKRISDEITRFLKQNNGWNREWLAWLEKQGKVTSWKPTKEQYEALDYAYNSCPDTERGNYYEGVLETLIDDLYRLEKQGYQKPVDKVEPKFKVGNWIVFNNKHQSVYQVEKIEDGYYILRHTHGGTFKVCVLHDESLRLWTIQDAKDGDVLVYKGTVKNSNGIKYERICLFSSLNKAFFTLTKTSNLVEDYGIDVNVNYPNNTTPATKGQKEILFMVMKEVGYKWNGKEVVPIKDTIIN